MAHSSRAHFRRALLAVLDDAEIVVRRRGVLREPGVHDGSPLKGLWDSGTITVALPEHTSWDDAVLTVLHEAIHGLPLNPPEYIVDEALDRVAFTSPRLRWKASTMLGDAVCGYGGEKVVKPAKPRK